MVLRLKTRESRSLPGLQKRDVCIEIPSSLRSKTPSRLPRRRFCCCASYAELIDPDCPTCGRSERCVGAWRCSEAGLGCTWKPLWPFRSRRRAGATSTQNRMIAPGAHGTQNRIRAPPPIKRSNSYQTANCRSAVEILRMRRTGHRTAAQPT
jgi:hypothetical protein